MNVNHLVPLVMSIAMKMAGKTGWRVPTDDLFNAGMMGLQESAARFDPKRGVQFNTFAMPRATWAMVDRLRSYDHLGRQYRKRVKLGIDKNWVKDPQPMELLQLEATAPPAAIAEAKEIFEKAEQLLGVRARHVLELRFHKGLTCLEIARRLRLSESRISQIVTRSVARLRRVLR